MNTVSRTCARGGVVVAAALCVLASMTYAAEPTILTNGVAVSGLSGSAGSEKFYQITVPAGQDTLEISTSGGTGDVDLYVRRGSLPTTAAYDYRPYKVGTNETVNVENPTAGTWYIMLRGYAAYSGVTLKATYAAATSVKTLTNGVPATGISGAAEAELYYSIEVPAGQTKLEIAMSGGTGDADLYVKQGALPTTTVYDYRPFLVGNEETVTVETPAAGTWYVMIRGYSAFSGITLLASHGGGTGGGTVLENGVPVTGIAGTRNSEKLYRFDVPAGQTKLEITMSGGTGDADLYVRLKSPPTQTEYDYRPFQAGNEERVAVDNPTPGTWFVLIRGYSDYAGVTLLATWAGAVSVTTLQDAVPVKDLAGALGSEQFFKIDVPAGQDALNFSLSGGTGNADMYIRKGSKPTTTEWDYRPLQGGNTESVAIGGDTLEGTWYVMLKGSKEYSGVTLVADYSATEKVVTLTNNVPVSNISGTPGTEKMYKIDVPAGQTKLEIRMSGGTGDADMYVRRGAQPTTSTFDYRPYLIGNDEAVTVTNPTAGTWYIMIRGYQAFSGITLLATYGGSTPSDPVTTLQNDVAVTGIAGAAGAEKFFKIDVPAGQSKLDIVMSGGTGDVDLYVRKGSKPTTTEWDYRPYLVGNNETVTIDNPAAATYYIMLRGYDAFDGVSLKATYAPVAEPVTTLQNGVPLTGLAGATGTEKFYKIEVPTGQDFLTIETSGGTGDLDLYVKKGSKPTGASWDYRPYLIGNNEKVDIENPAAATWYIMLRAYEAYSGVTLKATYGGKPLVGNNFASDPNAVALWRFESGKLVTDTLKGHTLANKGVTAQTTDYKEGASAADFEVTQSDYLSIPDANLSAAYPHKDGKKNGKISLCFWVKFESLPAAGSGRDLYGKSAVGGNSFFVKVYNSLGVTRLEVGIGYDNGTKWQSEYHTSPLAAGVWYHVIILHDDTTGNFHIRIWDDAAKAILGTDKAGKFAFKMSYNNSPVYIGSGFDGLLDEMVVFNDLLTAAEMDKIRQGTYGKEK